MSASLDYAYSQLGLLFTFMSRITGNLNILCRTHSAVAPSLGVEKSEMDF